MALLPMDWPSTFHWPPTIFLGANEKRLWGGVSTTDQNYTTLSSFVDSVEKITMSDMMVYHTERSALA
jgi:hypothetical protein